MTPVEQKIFANLKQSRYLQQVPEASLHKFLSLIDHQSYPAGSLVISQGQENHDVFFIVSGSVAIKTDGRRLYTLGRNGDIFGEMSVVTGQPSQSTVEALDDLQLLSISSQLLRSIRDDSSHELSYVFYGWLSRILADKLFLASQKAKRYEDVNAELQDALEIQQVVSDRLMRTTAELQRSKGELEELNQLKNEFIGIASHDLRSPIGGVIAVMETLPSCFELPPEVVELLGSVRETCQEQLALVNSLLDVAKIESGQLELERTPFSVAELIAYFEQQEQRSRLLARSKQIELSFDRQPLAASLAVSGSSLLSFDAPKIQQVLNNLLGNAIKFSSCSSASPRPHRGCVSFSTG